MQIGDILYEGMSTRSPWFDRGADNARFTYQVIANQGSPTPDATFSVKVLHKNYDETGNGSDTSADFGLIPSNPGFHSATVEGLKEQVRFEFSVSGTGQVLYRLLQPTWFDTAEA